MQLRELRRWEPDGQTAGARTRPDCSRRGHQGARARPAARGWCWWKGVPGQRRSGLETEGSAHRPGVKGPSARPPCALLSSPLLYPHLKLVQGRSGYHCSPCAAPAPSSLINTFMSTCPAIGSQGWLRPQNGSGLTFWGPRHDAGRLGVITNLFTQETQREEELWIRFRILTHLSFRFSGETPGYVAHLPF